MSAQEVSAFLTGSCGEAMDDAMLKYIVMDGPVG